MYTMVDFPQSRTESSKLFSESTWHTLYYSCMSIQYSLYPLSCRKYRPDEIRNTCLLYHCKHCLLHVKPMVYRCEYLPWIFINETLTICSVMGKIN